MTDYQQTYRPESEPEMIYPLSPEAVAVPDDWTSQITLDEVRQIYVKTNYERFGPVFDECDAFGKMRASLALAPFFFGYLWFFYRKMYLEGFLVLMAGFIVMGVIQTLAVQAPEMAPLAGLGLNLAVSLILAVYAKALYWKAVDRQIEKAMRLYPQDPARAISWLDNVGGVNVWIVVLVALIMLVVIGGLIALMAFMVESGTFDNLRMMREMYN